MNDLDSIVAEMSEVRAELEDLDPAETTRRAELRSRLDGLRAAARDMRRGAPRVRADLEAELAALEARWDRLQRMRVDVVRQAGGAEGGDFGSITEAMRINASIDAANARDEIEARIREVRSLLADV